MWLELHKYNRLMQRWSFLILTFLAVHTSYGQQGKSSLELAIIPRLGFNTSYSTFQKGYNKEYNSIKGNSSFKDFYFGLGLQLVYSEDMALNLHYARSGIGAGYRTKDLFYGSGDFERAVSRASSPVNMLDASIEKNLIKLKFFKNRRYYTNCNLSGSLGLRYISIVAPNRTDSLYPLPPFSTQLIQEIGYEREFRNGGVAISTGLGAQVFIRGHRSLKVGVRYHYLLRPIFEYQFRVTTRTYENGIYRAYNDEFNLFAGRHQLLFYLEYPIRLLKIKF